MRTGRPKEFDRRLALEHAMQLFWSRGYAGAGLAQLLSEMGISRQSLYDTFGSKRGLFIQAIEHYRATQLVQALSLLERDRPPLENVKDVMGFFEELAADARCRGCLIANALVEVAPHDLEIARVLEDTLDRLQEALQGALEQASKRGELPGGKSPPALARALTNAMIGLAVTGKVRRGRAALHDIYTGTLAMLD